MLSFIAQDVIKNLSGNEGKLIRWQSLIFLLTFFGYASVVLQRKAFTLVVPYIDYEKDGISAEDIGLSTQHYNIFSRFYLNLTAVSRSDRQRAEPRVCGVQIHSGRVQRQSRRAVFIWRRVGNSVAVDARFCRHQCARVFGRLSNIEWRRAGRLVAGDR